ERERAEGGCDRSAAARRHRVRFLIRYSRMLPVAIVQAPMIVSRDFIDYPYFANLGAVQTAAVVRGAGRDVALVDALAMDGSGCEATDDGRLRIGASPRDVAARIPRASAVVLALTPFHRPPSRDPMIANVVEALRASQPTTPIVIADLYQS